METGRRPFQGVLNILSFNRHYYVFGLAFLGLLFASRFFFEWQGPWFWLAMAAFLYGLIMPLIVSAYVYDFSGYYHLRWLDNLVGNTDEVRSIVNINAGFDETSFLLKKKFPRSQIAVLDFYDAKQHTEVAIKRARKASLVYPGTEQINTAAIPAMNASADIVFLLSAAHEIRSNDEKVVFLKECLRICKPGGKVVMVEHLRDFPNFLAFSVGFTHFFSRATWKMAFERAGFNSVAEKKFTPFMSVFTCKPDL
jgi:ubiquinone/menaquinone biosynthesis C-methylase UbiE